MNRGLRAAVLGCLAGAALVLLAAAQVWVTVRLPTPPPLPGRRLALTGAELVPALRPLALLGLAGAAALLATRRWGRAVVGALVTAAGLLVLVGAVRLVADPAGAVARARPEVSAPQHVSGWPAAAAAGGLLLALSGGGTVLRSHRWAGLGRRYEPPAAAAAGPAPDPWAALDRGEDPTR